MCVSSSSVLKHSTACLLASIFLLFGVTFEERRMHLSSFLSHTKFTPNDDEGIVTEGKREKTKIILGTQSKARAGWPKRLGLVQVTP